MQERDGIKIWDVSGRVLSGVLVAFIAAMGFGIGNLFLRVTAIESNRFTSSDWIQERRDLLNDIPPPEVLQRLRTLEDEVNRLRRFHEPGG